MKDRNINFIANVEWKSPRRHSLMLKIGWVGGQKWGKKKKKKCYFLQHNLSQYMQFSPSVRSDSATPWTAACQASLSITNFQSLLKPMTLNWWCHPIISCYVIPFSSCPQSFPASESFHMSQLFASGGQSIGVSASTSVLPINTLVWSPLGWTGWITFQVQGTLKSLLQHHSSKALILLLSTFLVVQLSHPHMMTGKTIALTRQTLLTK